MAEYTANVDGVGTLRLLDAVKTCGLTNTVKFYQASTSELFGKVQEIPQTETTPFYPRSPYGNTQTLMYTMYCSSLWKHTHGLPNMFYLAPFVKTIAYGHVREQRLPDSLSPCERVCVCVSEIEGCFSAQAAFELSTHPEAKTFD